MIRVHRRMVFIDMDLPSTMTFMRTRRRPKLNKAQRVVEFKHALLIVIPKGRRAPWLANPAALVVVGACRTGLSHVRRYARRKENHHGQRRVDSVARGN
jgi:hypothetical protein